MNAILMWIATLPWKEIISVLSPGYRSCPVRLGNMEYKEHCQETGESKPRILLESKEKGIR